MRSFRAPFELILVVRDQLVDRPGSILFFVHNKKNLAPKKYPVCLSTRIRITLQP